MVELRPQSAAVSVIFQHSHAAFLADLASSGQAQACPAIRQLIASCYRIESQVAAFILKAQVGRRYLRNESVGHSVQRVLKDSEGRREIFLYRKPCDVGVAPRVDGNAGGFLQPEEIR